MSYGKSCRELEVKCWIKRSWFLGKYWFKWNMNYLHYNDLKNVKVGMEFLCMEYGLCITCFCRTYLVTTARDITSSMPKNEQWNGCWRLHTALPKKWDTEHSWTWLWNMVRSCLTISKSCPTAWVLYTFCTPIFMETRPPFNKTLIFVANTPLLLTALYGTLGSLWQLDLDIIEYLVRDFNVHIF